jgi:replicative superfamily II helicase
LRERVSDTVDDLFELGFVDRDGLQPSPTRLRRLASNLYLRLDTARRFATLAERSADGDALEATDLLRAVATAGEFESASARKDKEDAARRRR